MLVFSLKFKNVAKKRPLSFLLFIISYIYTVLLLLLLLMSQPLFVLSICIHHLYWQVYIFYTCHCIVTPTLSPSQFASVISQPRSASVQKQFLTPLFQEQVQKRCSFDFLYPSFPPTFLFPFPVSHLLSF